MPVKTKRIEMKVSISFLGSLISLNTFLIHLATPKNIDIAKNIVLINDIIWTISILLICRILLIISSK